MGDKMNLQDCVDLATFAHRHQRDKAGEPYINHPKRVLANVQAQGAQAFVQMAAVLHDVTEDTPFNPDMLLTLGVPEAAVEIVRLVDRDESELEFCQRGLASGLADMGREFKERRDAFYYEQIRKNPGAVQVKLADIGDNLQPWRLSYLPPDTQTRLRAKYAAAMKQLTGV